MIRLDPRTSTILNALDNKKLQIIITDIPVNIEIIFDSKGIKVPHDFKVPDTIASLSGTETTQVPGTADDMLDTVTVEGNKTTFATLWLNKNTHFVNPDLSLRGNVAIAENAFHLFSKLEIDWEDILSRYTGSIIAHSVGKLFKSLRKKHQQFNQKLGQNIFEYLQEEAHILPSVNAFEVFSEDVDDLSAKTDRLFAKLALLENKLSKDDTPHKNELLKARKKEKKDISHEYL